MKEAEDIKHKLLKNEIDRLRIENKKKELINELYNQMLSHFLDLEREFRDQINKSKLSNSDFSDKVEELSNNMNRKLTESFAKIIIYNQFGSFMRNSLDNNLNSSELLMCFLINCKLSNKEISVIFKTTPSSIRSRKHLLKRKMIELGADTSFF